MVKLRLRRGGKKKSPHYRIVATDSRYPREGRFLEILGYYCPVSNPKKLEIDARKALVWLQNGAQPTDTVKNLLSKKGIMKMWHEVRVNKKTIDDVLPTETEIKTKPTVHTPIVETPVPVEENSPETDEKAAITEDTVSESASTDELDPVENETAEDHDEATEKE